MEGITRTENNWRDDLTSGEPHFNDERTIRSAQPVVPLQTVVRERRRHALMLVGAFVIACLLGATAAMALIRLRQTTTVPATAAAPTAVNSAQPEDDAATANDAETSAAEPDSESQSIAQADTSASEEPKEEKKKKPKKHAMAPLAITVVTSPSANTGQPRMVDQWEEKRQRRVSRQRDPMQNNHPSDLFRIREIFEGPRRSRRTKSPQQ
jgi:hypothetical protein